MSSHGKPWKYDRGCRCEKCSEARSKYVKVLRAVRARLPLPSYVEHGTINAYKHYGCRCIYCKATNTISARQWRRTR